MTPATYGISCLQGWAKRSAPIKVHEAEQCQSFEDGRQIDFREKDCEKKSVPSVPCFTVVSGSPLTHLTSLNQGGG